MHRYRLILPVVLGLVLCGAAPGRAAPEANYIVTKVRIYPQAGHAEDMKGGQVLGSLTSATNDFEMLATIKEAPADGAWTELTIPADRARAYRFVKFMARNGTHGAVAELEFYAGDRKLTGTPFATSGGKAAENDPARAFDGDTGTFFAGEGTYQQYVGLDLGPDSQVVAPAFSVAQGLYPAAQTVTLSTSTPGAVILYSVDGWGRPRLDKDGKVQGGKRYDGTPLTITKSAIVEAVALKAGLAESTAALAAYHIGAVAGDPAEHAEFHIGNSLTDTVDGWMVPIATSAGQKMRYYRFTIPGAPTDWLWDHPGSGFGEANYAQAFLARAPLTDLVTQPFFGHSRSIDNEAEYSGRFFDLARKYSPKVQMWLYVQWPGEKFDDNWSRGKSSDLDAAGKRVEVTLAAPATTYQEAIDNHVRYTEQVMERMNTQRAAEIEAGQCQPVLIIPGGLALKELKTRIDAGTMPGLTDFAKEIFSGPGDIHLSPKGRYLISLVHYACIYRDDPVGKVTHANSGLTDEQATIFQEIAWQAAKGYRWSGLKDAGK